MNGLRYINVVNSVEAWGRLASMKLNASVAYKVLKYMQRLDEEFKAFEKQRAAAVCEAAGAEPGSSVALESGSDAHGRYIGLLDELLAVEVETGKIDLSIEDILCGSGEISVSDLAVLEPFFSEPKEV